MTNNHSTELQRHFSAFREQQNAARETLAQVRSSIRKLQEEAADLKFAPASREDFVRAIFADIDRQAEEGRKRVERMILGHRQGGRGHGVDMHVNSTQFELSHVRDVIAGTKSFGAVGAALARAIDPHHLPSEGFMFDHVGLCAVLGEQLKGALLKNLESFEWPYANALPAADRSARLAEIEEELRPLCTQESELVELLASVGLGGESPHRPTPADRPATAAPRTAAVYDDRAAQAEYAEQERTSSPMDN